MKLAQNSVCALIIVCGFLVTDAVAAKKNNQSILFGPTGIEGVASKSSIKVSGAQKGSPADGALKKGDEIIGVGGSKFKNPKNDMVLAIDVSESKQAGGKMVLMLKGNKTAEITLPVLGSYSATAPFNCPKTDAIITKTAEALLRDKSKDGSRIHPELLGLMATGEKKYIDHVAARIKEESWAKPDQAKIDQLLAGEGDMGYVGWSFGYHAITLAEYYILTGDKSVLPAIKTYAVALAKGQDAGGLWGHRLISPKRNYRLPGYAQMNQTSLSCFLALLLAKKAGIQDPALDKAIKKTYYYVADHVDKGCFKYGVHGPNSAGFNNNGTSGSAALSMSFSGHTQGARFFSQMSATSYDGLEAGHASNYFNSLWTPLGANLSGPEVYSKFFKKTLWFQNLRRNWDGNWTPKSKEGPSGGRALLTYCAPRRVLLITGRKADESIWVEGKEADAVVGLSKIDYKSLSPETLMDMAVNHSMPQVRRGAMGSLVEHRDKLTPTWVKYLKEGNAEQKKLAISQYGWWIPIEIRKPQMELIGAILQNPKEPQDVRVAAAGSLAHYGEPAQKYYMDIVRLLAEDKSGDPFALIDMGLGSNLLTLSKTAFESGLVTDKETYYKAAMKLIKHKRQGARASGLTMLAGMPLEDFHLVADEIINVLEDKDPSYHSYHNPGGPLTAGISLLADLSIEEGIEYALNIGKIPSGKGSFKMKATWASLAKYGANAKPALEELKERYEGKTDFGRHTGAYNSMVKAITIDEAPKKLISLEAAKKAGQ